jgi:hypothetical protein
MENVASRDGFMSRQISLMCRANKHKAATKKRAILYWMFQMFPNEGRAIELSLFYTVHFHLITPGDPREMFSHGDTNAD